MRRVVLVSALVVALAGCSGSSAGTHTGSSGGASGSEGTVAAPGAEGVAASVSATDLCSALKQVRTKGGTQATRRASTRTTLAQVYSASRLSGQMKPAEVDAKTKESCPQIRTKILHATGLSTLADI